MPFRCRQKLQMFSAGEIFYSVGNVNPDTGIMEYCDQCQSVKLPDVEMTDLAASLKAGVDLKQVNCKLLSPSGLSQVANDLVFYKEIENAE